MKSLAKKVGKDIPTSQVRKIFSEIKRLSWKLKHGEKIEVDKAMVRLKPRIAYIAARKNVLKPLYDRLNSYISSTKEEKDLDKLAFALETFIAYQKYFKEYKEG